MSKFGTIESSGYAVVQGIVGFAETRLVAAARLLSYTPQSYPAAVVALSNPEKMKPDAEASPGHISLRFRCEFAVLVHANSDDQELGDARLSAWTLVDAVVDAFSAPPWIPPIPSTVATVWPAEVGAPLNVLTDAGKSVVYIPITVEIQWRT